MNFSQRESLGTHIYDKRVLLGNGLLPLKRETVSLMRNDMWILVPDIIWRELVLISH